MTFSLGICKVIVGEGWHEPGIMRSPHESQREHWYKREASVVVVPLPVEIGTDPQYTSCSLFHSSHESRCAMWQQPEY